MIVYTGGTFDLLHVGHLELLRECRRIAGHAGTVVASVNRDEFVERYKGRAPAQDLATRLELVRSVRFVDAAVVNTGDEDSRPAMKCVRPDVLAIGTDWLDPDHDERRYHAQLGVTPEWLRERGLWVEYIPRTRGTSTTRHPEEPRVIDILVPSRGRPERAEAMAASVRATATRRAGVRVHLIVDADDPELARYSEIPHRVRNATVVVLPERVGYTASLNQVAAMLAHEAAPPAILGAFGDDVLFRTRGWDYCLRHTLAQPGLAYGEDLVHGVNHPTAVFMCLKVYRALGWLALPATTHQWADDGWKSLGASTGVLRFMRGVVFEHMHPAVGKAEWDATYASVFTEERAKRDYDGYTAWLADGLAADAAKVRAVLR